MLLSFYTRLICAPYGRLVHMLVATSFAVLVVCGVLTIADWHLAPTVWSSLWPIATICVITTAVPLSLFSASLIVRLDRLSVQLLTLAATDTLTGALNRRGFVEQTIRGLGACRDPGASHFVTMLDIDHFKTINDSFGHAIGDQALRLVAGATRDCVGRADLVGRLGGEEFVIAHERSGAQCALQHAEHLRRTIDAIQFVHNERQVPLTASVGVAQVRGNTRWALDDALNRADNALYRAKRQGRNRVVADWEYRCDKAAIPLPRRTIPLRQANG